MEQNKGALDPDLLRDLDAHIGRVEEQGGQVMGNIETAAARAQAVKEAMKSLNNLHTQKSTWDAEGRDQVQALEAELLSYRQVLEQSRNEQDGMRDATDPASSYNRLLIHNQIVHYQGQIDSLEFRISSMKASHEQEQQIINEQIAYYRQLVQSLTT